MRLQSALKSAIKAPSTQYIVPTFIALLIMAVVALLFPSGVAASATNIYLAQDSAGAASGTACADALPVSFFTSSANWGSGANQIGPGTTVHLCGTITTALSFQGSGASGNPVVLDGTGATMDQTIIISGRSWDTIQNVTWQANYNLTPFVIELEHASNIVIQGNFLDSFLANGNTGGGDIVWLGSNGGQTDTVDIKNNTFGYSSVSTNVQSDVISTEGATNVIVEGNVLTQRNPDNGQHNDLTQTFCKSAPACPAGTPANWTIRYNKYVMNTTATNNKSWCMIENMGGTLLIYNNLFLGLQGDSAGNGCSISGASGSPAPQTQVFYGNTFIALNGSMTNLIDCNYDVPCNVENNIVYTTAGSSNALKREVTKRNNNLWYGPASPSCSGFTGEICNEAPSFVNMATNNFSLQAGSPGISAAVNLGSPYNMGVAVGAAWPNPALAAQASGTSWNMGAYSSGVSASQPLAPTDLTASVVN